MPTIGELFRNPNSYKYGTNYSEVKSDTETLVEQETSGVRIRSAVELNNPLIYGNESIRIMNRSTSVLEDMKSGTGGAEGGGGLIGQGLSKLTGGKVSSISQARDAVNSKIGIPITAIPSRVVTKTIDSDPTSPTEGSLINSATPITRGLFDDGGSEVGKFLKGTGGGNPKTIFKQALGKGIGLAKDKLRGALFGEQGTIGDAIGDNNGFNLEYHDQNTYTQVMTDTSRANARDIYNEGGVLSEGDNPIPFGNQSIETIDLRLVSPIYGVQRKDNEGYFGRQPGQGGSKSSYAFINRKNPKGVQSFYNPAAPYTGVDGDTDLNTLETSAGVGKRDKINSLTISDDYTIGDDGSVTVGDDVIKDLIPLHIGKLGAKMTVFRSTIKGISETVSPSWSSKKFVGNPYSYYTYDGIERNVTFTLNIYCMSPLELQANWERITTLTKMAYPSITSGRKVNPPIIKFRLGDIYVDKIGFIDSLTHSIPDNSNWETDGEFGYLPKLIDVSITIKFIEDENVTAALYGYKKSEEAIEALNEEREANNVSLGNRTNADGSLKYEEPVKLTPRGIAKTEININAGGSLKEKLTAKTKKLKILL